MAAKANKSSNSNREKERVNRHEQAAVKLKQAREESIRKYAKSTFLNHNASMICVRNVYGDAYRINFFADHIGDEGIVKTKRLVGSEFVRMKVELPGEPAGEAFNEDYDAEDDDEEETTGI